MTHEAQIDHIARSIAANTREQIVETVWAPAIS